MKRTPLAAGGCGCAHSSLQPALSEWSAYGQLGWFHRPGRGCDRRDRDTRGDGSSDLVIGVSSDPQTLDPEFGQATRANETLKNIYAQWVRYPPLDPSKDITKADVSRVVPEAFKSWKVRRRTGRSTFTLRPGAKFPSGRSITADDFIYKVNRALGVKFGSVFVFNILGITKPSQVKKINGMTFQIKLPAGSPILGPMMRDQDAGIVDTELVKKNSTKADPWGTKWLARTGAAASGAYVIGEYVPGTRMTLKANPRYWGPKPYFTTVVLQVIPSSQNRVLLLRNGSIDIAEDLSVEDAVRLKGQARRQGRLVPDGRPEHARLRRGQEAVQRRSRQAGHRLRDPVPTARRRAAARPGQGREGRLAPELDLVPEGAVSVQARHREGEGTARPGRILRGAHLHGRDQRRRRGRPGARDPAQDGPCGRRRDDEHREAVGCAVPEEPQRAVAAGVDRIEPRLVRDDPYYHSFLWLGTDSVINWFKYSNPLIDSSQKEFANVLSVAQRRALARQVQVQLNKDLPFISLGEPNYLLPVRRKRQRDRLRAGRARDVPLPEAQIGVRSATR